MALPTVAEMAAYIRESAIRRGADPDIALKVARSEGLAPNTWQSRVVKNGKRETSYGPFQLLVGGGLGDEFKQTYGKSPADPSTWRQQVDFAIDKAAEGGWSPWYGAAKVGVGPRMGLENARSLGVREPHMGAVGSPQDVAHVAAGGRIGAVPQMPMGSQGGGRERAMETAPTGDKSIVGEILRAFGGQQGTDKAGAGDNIASGLGDILGTFGGGSRGSSGAGAPAQMQQPPAPPMQQAPMAAPLQAPAPAAFQLGQMAAQYQPLQPRMIGRRV